jgi:phosphopantetheinyl transferase
VKLAGEPLKGRSGHAAGRELLARLYREETGHDLPPIEVALRGKPYFPDDPRHFSISHTKGHVFCVLCDRPVGLDAEEMDRIIDLRLAKKILSEPEMARFDTAADQRRALLKLWVLKEAAAKLTGEGLRGYPNHTDFSPDDPRVLEMDGCYVAVLTE